MKISRIFGINKSQAELDFIDVNIQRDKLLFVDPFLISNNADEWSLAASHTIQSFFQYVLNNIRSGNITAARQAFRHLHEPNDTCLGMSRGRPRGRGVGSDNAGDLFEAIRNSRAVETGLVTDIQDTTLFIDNIGRDKISDMTTNIIRKHLIEYTQAQADLWDFGLRPNTNSGFYWDDAAADWRNELASMLVLQNRRILLVPKSAVSYFDEYTASNYHQHDVLDFLKSDHLRRNTNLVRTRVHKDGTKTQYVTKEDLKEKVLPLDKALLIDFSRTNPEVYESFKARLRENSNPLSNEELDSTIDLSVLIDFLIAELGRIPSGVKNADNYHNLIKGITELIFYPNLVSPTKEARIHGGRKRIDIIFRNAAKSGFFEEFIRHHAANYVPVECKNYAEDRNLSNPEFDQMLGRLAPARGIFGIITCRTATDPHLLLERSRDAYRDNRKIIITLTDQELIQILQGVKNGVEHPEYAVLQAKVDQIILA